MKHLISITKIQLEPAAFKKKNTKAIGIMNSSWKQNLSNRKIVLLACLFFACNTNPVQEAVQSEPFIPYAVSDDEWTTYESKWIANDGTIRLELSLKNGTPGHDSEYKLGESYESDSSASGTNSKSTYTVYKGFPENEIGICLHNIDSYRKGSYLRFKKSEDMPDEMFFITRGTDELLPCDDHFKPITSDRRYTLHKRSKLFTVEGYFTLENDSLKFFERNTREHWKVTDLGEFDELLQLYKQLAKEKFQGIYLKGLAYSVADTTVAGGKNVLVIKQIVSVGNDPD
jgi:hypothetical protein